MTYLPDEMIDIIEHELQRQNLAIGFALDGWAYDISYNNYIGKIEQYLVELTGAAADIDKTTEEVTEWKEYSGVTYYWTVDTVWDMIKLKWLRFFRAKLGLTAPFFQPKFVRKPTTYEFTAPTKLQRTNVTRVVAAPGTRTCRTAHNKTGRFGGNYGNRKPF